LDSLEDLLQLTLSVKADMLQLHPLSNVGRAAEEHIITVLSPTDRAIAYSLCRILALENQDIKVQADLIHTDEIPDFLAEQLAQELPSILVLRDDGRLVPDSYGVAGLVLNRLEHSVASFDFASSLLNYRQLLTSTATHLAAQPGVHNWHEALELQSASLEPNQQHHSGALQSQRHHQK
jgi:hypothetical protein